MTVRKSLWYVIIMITLLIPTHSSMAARRRPPMPSRFPMSPNQGGMQRRQPTPPSQEEMKQMLLSSLQTKLGATAQEWATWRPKFIAFFELLEQTRATDGQRFYQSLIKSPAHTMAQRFRPPTLRWNRNQTEVEGKRVALDSVLQRTSSSPQSVTEALAAYREARKQVTEQLTQAAMELRSLLKEKQQAQLVALGILE